MCPSFSAVVPMTSALLWRRHSSTVRGRTTADEKSKMTRGEAAQVSPSSQTQRQGVPPAAAAISRPMRPVEPITP